MEDLPQELVDRIIHYVKVALLEEQAQWVSISWEHQYTPTSRFASYASICRTWKEAVEGVIFSRITVKDDELDAFETIVTGRRRSYVTELSLTVSGLDGQTKAGEPLEEQSAKNQRFTNALCKLFRILKVWEDEGVRKPLRLYFPMVSVAPMDRLRAMASFESFVFTHVLTGLPEHMSLPRLSNVTYLNVYGGSSRRLEPTTASTIAAALPNLREITLEFDDEFPKDKDRRLGMRTSFAEVIKDICLQPRAVASIKSLGYTPDGHREHGGNLVPSHLSYDPYSAGLRIFSQNLSSLSLTTCLDSTIFWPSPHESNAPTPYWPFLKDLYINFSLVSPSGEWYFTGPDYYREDDFSDDPDLYWEYYRVDPDPVTFSPFIEAFAKAVEKMPILEFFHLTSEVEDVHGEGKFSIKYHAPGRDAELTCDEEEDDKTVRRVTYDLTDNAKWRPSHEVREALKNVGREKFGGEVIESFRGGYGHNHIEESEHG
jgi:hypothetical protein